jgi:hypothetical protein
MRLTRSSPARCADPGSPSNLLLFLRQLRDPRAPWRSTSDPPTASCASGRPRRATRCARARARASAHSRMRAQPAEGGRGERADHVRAAVLQQRPAPRCVPSCSVRIGLARVVLSARGRERHRQHAQRRCLRTVRAVPARFPPFRTHAASTGTIVRATTWVMRVCALTRCRHAQPAHALHLRHGRVRDRDGDAGVQGAHQPARAVRQVQRRARRDVRVVRALLRPLRAHVHAPPHRVRAHI